MHDKKLVVKRRKARKYSSYKGEISEALDVDKADELLDYLLGEDNVITQIEVLYRTI